MLGNIWEAHDSSPCQNNFINGIQIHDLNPWQFVYPRPNSYWQHQSPIFIGNIKTQFSLVISKTQLTLALFKTQFSLAISKAQLALALLKTQANYLALSYQKPKVIKYLAKYYIIIISLKSPIINNTLNS